MRMEFIYKWEYFSDGIVIKSNILVFPMSKIFMSKIFNKRFFDMKKTYLVQQVELVDWLGHLELWNRLQSLGIPKHRHQSQLLLLLPIVNNHRQYAVMVLPLIRMMLFPPIHTFSDKFPPAAKKQTKTKTKLFH